MDFMEAVKAMKEGKTVSRKKTWHLEPSVLPSIQRWGSKTDYVAPIEISDVEATDWEVVDDDKDWNLASKEEEDDDHYIDRLFIKRNVKKCRDLILQDLENAMLEQKVSYEMFIRARNIVNKRFGDLE